MVSVCMLSSFSLSHACGNEPRVDDFKGIKPESVQRELE